MEKSRFYQWDIQPKLILSVYLCQKYYEIEPLIIWPILNPWGSWTCLFIFHQPNTISSCERMKNTQEYVNTQKCQGQQWTWAEGWRDHYSCMDFSRKDSIDWDNGAERAQPSAEWNRWRSPTHRWLQELRGTGTSQEEDPEGGPSRHTAVFGNHTQHWTWKRGKLPKLQKNLIPPGVGTPHPKAIWDACTFPLISKRLHFRRGEQMLRTILRSAEELENATTGMRNWPMRS